MISTPNQEYTASLPLWTKCRDTVAGEDVIKSKTTTYLPRLIKQSLQDYNNYLLRAYFFNATGRTLQALLGALFRKPFIGYDNEAIVSFNNETLEQFAIRTAKELITTSRVGILVDMPPYESNYAYLTLYKAEDIINWRTENGNLTLVVLKETYFTPINEFEQEPKVRYRVLTPNPYTVSVYNEREELIEEYNPQHNGKDLSAIPFIFINTVSTTPDIEKPLLLDIASINLSHYLTTADLEWGRHFTGLPTPYAAGFDFDNELSIGSSTAWISQDPQAKAGYLEFTGQGLKALETALEHKERCMAVLGARLLEAPKKATETIEALQFKSIGESNTLATLSTTLSEGFSKAMSIKSTWENGPAVTIKFNNDFNSFRLPPQDLQQLLATYQAGAISLDTLLYNLQKGEILPPNTSIDDEKINIENEVRMLNVQ